MNAPLEFGLDTFGDVTRDGAGNLLPQAEVLRHVVAEGVLADEVGVDAFGVGEHHRADFAIAAPEIVLAAIASRTRRMLLGSSVTVLSSDEPVRVFQRFATLDAVSGGRAEVILGRGSFTESFPLFGYSLEDYDVLFEEKLELFAKLLEHNRTGDAVTWSGTTRAAMNGLKVYPRTESGTLKTWIGVGGSPESVVRAARYGLPLMLAIIGGDPRRFLQFIDLYYRALDQFGKPRLPVGIHSHGHIADSDAQAREELWPAWRDVRNRIGSERGWGPAGRAEFDREVETGSLYVGTPDTVARRIAATVKALGVSRFHMKYSAGTLSHELLMRCIELYGREVIPRVRELLAAPAAEVPRARAV